MPSSNLTRSVGGISTLSRRDFCRSLSMSPLAALSAAAAPLEGGALREILSKIRSEHKLPALAGAILDTSGLQQVAVAGVRKAGTTTEATVKDLWHLGSDTKAMTASLVAMLVDEGKLKWDDNLASVLRGQGKLKNSDLGKVTVRQLLHHTSGLPANLNWSAIAAKGGIMKAQRLAALLEAAQLRLAAAPGTAYLYSNAGYTIAGVLVEQLSGKSWEVFMQERLFKPLKMSSAGFGGVGTPGRLDQPWPHLENGSPMASNGPAVDNPPVMGPAGTVHATLGDWALFVADHLKGAKGQPGLLKPDSYKQLHAPELNDYAMGWISVQRPWAGGVALTHDGDNTMNHCSVWIAPTNGFAVLACTNRGGQGKPIDEAIAALIKHQAG